MYVRVSSWNTIGDNMNLEKILDKIAKKVDQVEKMHDKESIMCEEVKDLLADLRDQEEDEKWEDDSEEDFDEDIDEEEENE